MLGLVLLFFIAIKKQDFSDQFNDDEDLSNIMKKLSDEIKDGGKFALGKYHMLEKISIFLMGFSGSGKSTLINHIFHYLHVKTDTGKPVTKEIIPVEQNGIPLVLFDTPGFEFDDKHQKRLFNDMNKFIKKKQNSKNVSNHIHCLWYCISAESKRIQISEFQFIKKLIKSRGLENVPIIIVLTQCYDNEVRDSMIEAIKKENLNIAAIVPVLAKKKTIDIGSQSISVRPYGLRDLIEKTKEQLPDLLKTSLDYIIKDTNSSLMIKKIVSHVAIAGFTTVTTGVASSILPLYRYSFVVPLECSMLLTINKIYKVNMPLSFILNYIRWTFGGMKIDNDLLKEPENCLGANDYSYEYNSDFDPHYYLSLAFPSTAKSKPINNLFLQLEEFVCKMLNSASKSIKKLTSWFINAKGDRCSAIAVGIATPILGESYKSFIENIYLKKLDIKFNITADDIRNHIQLTYKVPFAMKIKEQNENSI